MSMKNENTYEMKPELIQESHRDEHSRLYGIYKCPYCCNFFIARKDSVDSGNTKSCGCLRREQASITGKANKKKNIIFYPLGMDYGVCYYDNVDAYFVFSKEYKDILENYHCTAKVNKKTNRIEPVVTVNGKTVLLSRLLMDTDADMEVDHINHNTFDLRMCNLRNCTKQQNNYNLKRGQGEVKCLEGKYYVDFPKENMSGTTFESEAEAFEKLHELQDKYFGEYSYRRSMEYAQEDNSYYFIREINHPVLKAISELPAKCWLNVVLHSVVCRWFSGKMSDINALAMLDKLIEDYKEFKASGELESYLKNLGRNIA